MKRNTRFKNVNLKEALEIRPLLKYKHAIIWWDDYHQKYITNDFKTIKKYLEEEYKKAKYFEDDVKIASINGMLETLEKYGVIEEPDHYCP